MKPFYVSETLEALARDISTAVRCFPGITFFVGQGLAADRAFYETGQPVLRVGDRMLIALHDLLAALPALLDDVPGILIDNRGMVAVTDDPFLGIPQGTGGTGFPHVITNLADVKWILQYVDHTFLIKTLASLCLVSMVIQISGDVIDVTAGGVHIKDLPDNGSLLLFDDRIFIRGFGVSQWHFTIIETLAGAGEHGTADFPGEVDGVELILPLYDHFNESAVHTVNQWFTDRYHINPQLLPEHGLIEGALILISCETAEFPQHNDIEGLRLGLRHCDHILESIPVTGLAAGASVLFDKDILRRQQDVMLQAVLFDLLKLGFRGNTPADHRC